MTRIHYLPCLDDENRAARLRQQLDLPHERARAIAAETLAILSVGEYGAPSGRTVAIGADVARARVATRSLPPDATLPDSGHPFDEMTIQVANETTLQASRRLLVHHRTLALNFANGFTPGGGFLYGARAQEESLCRAGALYATLQNDSMYEIHDRERDAGTSSHAILSPDVTFFRDDDGRLLETPYPLSVITCAAPEAINIGQERAEPLLRERIHRVLTIAAAFEYEALVLGAWGCGAFGNDAVATAADFRAALVGAFRGRFRAVVFAVTDWSPERRTLRPFRDAFAG